MNGNAVASSSRDRDGMSMIPRPSSSSMYDRVFSASPARGRSTRSARRTRRGSLAQGEADMPRKRLLSDYWASTSSTAGPSRLPLEEPGNHARSDHDWIVEIDEEPPYHRRPTWREYREIIKELEQRDSAIESPLPPQEQEHSADEGLEADSIVPQEVRRRRGRGHLFSPSTSLDPLRPFFTHSRAEEYPPDAKASLRVEILRPSRYVGEQYWSSAQRVCRQPEGLKCPWVLRLPLLLKDAGESCGRAFISTELLLRHIERCHARPGVTSRVAVCRWEGCQNRTFPTSQKLMEHLVDRHAPTLAWACPMQQCRQLTSLPTDDHSSKSHIKKVHDTLYEHVRPLAIPRPAILPEPNPQGSYPAAWTRTILLGQLAIPVPVVASKKRHLDRPPPSQLHSGMAAAAAASGLLSTEAKVAETDTHLHPWNKVLPLLDELEPHAMPIRQVPSEENLDVTTADFCIEFDCEPEPPVGGDEIFVYRPSPEAEARTIPFNRASHHDLSSHHEIEDASLSPTSSSPPRAQLGPTGPRAIDFWTLPLTRPTAPELSTPLPPRLRRGQSPSCAIDLDEYDEAELLTPPLGAVKMEDHEDGSEVDSDDGIDQDIEMVDAMDIRAQRAQYDGWDVSQHTRGKSGDDDNGPTTDDQGTRSTSTLREAQAGNDTRQDPGQASIPGSNLNTNESNVAKSTYVPIPTTPPPPYTSRSPTPTSAAAAAADAAPTPAAAPKSASATTVSKTRLDEWV